MLKIRRRTNVNYYLSHKYYPSRPMMINYPQIYYPYRPSNYWSVNYDRPELPGVDPTIFNESAIAFQGLMREASKIINKVADSKKFATDLMAAAQQSNQSKVNQLIDTTGVNATINTSFNPDGLKITLTTDVHGSDCCQLTMVLRWR
jgi:hypothetical protein